MNPYLVALMSYTVLLVTTTITATRAGYLLDAFFVTREMRNKTVNHVCDEPEGCPADFVLTEMKGSYSKVRTELALYGAAMVLGLIGCCCLIVALAGAR
jgi:hypothetical protein